MATAVDAPWMTAPAPRAVVDALAAEGAEVRFVGGCVRDALLGRESTDIDIGTPNPPERVLALLHCAGIETHTVPRGLEHGTVIAVHGGTRFEITTLRRDMATDGRHAEVAFTDDWEADAARRDFTISAMSLSPDGALHDYFDGQEDLRAGRMRFVGDPARRIAEDHLRILRFFRFHAWYGRGEPDAAALAACKAAAHTIPLFSPDKVNEIPRLSYERAQKELLKLLAAPDPASSVKAMRDTGVLARLLLEAQWTERLARLIEIERRFGEPDPIRRLAALVIDISYDRPFTNALWLRASDEIGRFVSLVGVSNSLIPSLNRCDPRHLIYELGPAQFRDVVMLAWADQGNDEASWQALLETARKWEPPTLPMRGADVLARGIPEGPEVGNLLRAVQNWWIEHDFQPDRAALLKKLDALIAESRDE